MKRLIEFQKWDTINHVKDVIVMLREYVKVGEVEKKKYGEVLTPLSLVKDMIQTIPSDFWKNPNSKILETLKQNIMRFHIFYYKNHIHQFQKEQKKDTEDLLFKLVMKSSQTI